MWGGCHFHPETKSRGWLGKRQNHQVAAKVWYGGCSWLTASQDVTSSRHEDGKGGLEGKAPEV